MNYTIFEPYKYDLDGNITEKISSITSPGDINLTGYIFCDAYYKSKDRPYYKSNYCHHREPLEVALKTVGKSIWPARFTHHSPGLFYLCFFDY